LNKRQIFWLYVEAEQSFKRVPKFIHRQDCIALKSLVEPLSV
jgi:hypothetical protein